MSQAELAEQGNPEQRFLGFRRQHHGCSERHRGHGFQRRPKHPHGPTVGGRC